MTWWLIYIWTRLNIICGSSLLIAVLCGLAFVGMNLEITDAQERGDDERKALAEKYMYRSCIFGTIAFLLFVLIPTKKDAAMIYVIPKMAQTETFNTISKETPEITKLALEALKETLQGMTKENKQ